MRMPGLAEVTNFEKVNKIKFFFVESKPAHWLSFVYN